jgi:hypothetical protein
MQETNNAIGYNKSYVTIEINKLKYKIVYNEQDELDDYTIYMKEIIR